MTWPRREQWPRGPSFSAVLWSSQSLACLLQLWCKFVASLSSLTLLCVAWFYSIATINVTNTLPGLRLLGIRTPAELNLLDLSVLTNQW